MATDRCKGGNHKGEPWRYSKKSVARMVSTKVRPIERQQQNHCNNGKRRGAAKRRATTKASQGPQAQRHGRGNGSGKIVKDGKRKGAAKRTTATKLSQGWQAQRCAAIKRSSNELLQGWQAQRRGQKNDNKSVARGATANACHGSNRIIARQPLMCAATECCGGNS
jgi:hypothetical protein